MTHKEIIVDDRRVGSGQPVYVIAEMSANHNQDFDKAVEIIYAAKDAGVDAIKIQTYTPDTITINSDNKYFQIGKGTIWEGQNLYNLYKEAYTPWKWQPRLKSIANSIGLAFFSSPFDKTAVDFLEKMDVSVYKIASPEIIDIPLIRYIAGTGKAIIMSTGMATLSEIDEAVATAREAGCKELALLKCTSAYPADPSEMNLRTIPHMSDAFCLPVGLSDHTLGIAVPVAAVALGACIIEKHLTLSRSDTGPDSAFSLEPQEFKAMVEAVRMTEKAIGQINYKVTEKEAVSRDFRRSLFIIKDMKAGESFTEENVRSIRPGNGLHTRYLEQVIGRKANQDVKKGTPVMWNLLI